MAWHRLTFATYYFVAMILFFYQKSPLLGRTFEFIGINREQSVRMHGLLLPYDGNLPSS
jgi:hypothetical protein